MGLFTACDPRWGQGQYRQIEALLEEVIGTHKRASRKLCIDD